MKFAIRLTLSLLTGITVLSCNNPSPRKYVEVAVLNTNLVTGMYAPGFFNELIELKERDRIMIHNDGHMEKGTAVEYVRQNVISPVDAAIEKVEALPVSEDTRDLAAASKAVLQYGKTIFEGEYIAIAVMLDDDRTRVAIDSAIQNLFNTHDPEMEKRIRRLDELAVPYAEKHKVPLSFK